MIRTTIVTFKLTSGYIPIIVRQMVEPDRGAL